MSDDLDNLLRAAMKTLDEQVPSGYFEALPNQTLARLEGSSMQHGTGTSSDVKNAAMVPPPVDPDTAPTAKQDFDREEDSGLHDIRNLAQSTKQRLSKKSITVNPPMSDEDILASSSGSFKNIALPQPAKMVSLPELADLPSKKEVLAAEKAAAKESKRSAKASKAPANVLADDASVSLAAVATVTDSPAMATEVAVPARSGFSLPSQQNKRSKAPLFAVLGLGVAAAAGAVIYTQMNSEKKDAAPAVAQADQNAALEAPKAPEATVAAGSAAPAERQKTDEELKAEAALEQAKLDAEKAEADAAAAGAAAMSDTGKDAPAPAKAQTKTAKGGKKGDHKVEVDLNEGKTETKTTEKPADTTKPKTGTGSLGNGATEQNEESFDKLLKEAGVEEKKDTKPKLEKKSLTTDDFKAGMATVASQAQACYKGTQGTASVKLTIGPAGTVTKVTVGGAFAGKPEAACVEAAVKSAKFPPWDGGPQSFTYAYMLSD
jgi:hypothetical protein